MTSSQDWRLEFDKAFIRLHDPDGIVKPVVKSFIKQTLASERQDIIAKVESIEEYTSRIIKHEDKRAETARNYHRPFDRDSQMNAEAIRLLVSDLIESLKK